MLEGELLILVVWGANIFIYIVLFFLRNRNSFKNYAFHDHAYVLTLDSIADMFV